MSRIAPIPLPDPEALMAPGDLAVALEVAGLCDGERPRWYRDAPDETGPPPLPIPRNPGEAELS